MVTSAAIVAYVEELAGHPLYADEGVQYGPANREVKHILVCWMSTGDALRHAQCNGVDLVLTHESLYYPYGAPSRSDLPFGWQGWQTNRQRREWLEQGNMVLMGAHGSLDEICIYDDFAAWLGLGNPVKAVRLAKVYEITACPLSELIAWVKSRTGMPALRASCPMGLDQVVRRVGLPWGGLGLFVNVAYQQQLIEMGCDVLIAGESDDYGFRFSAECGIPMIETGHSISENPGLEHFARMLQARFPEVDIEFHSCPASWCMA